MRIIRFFAIGLLSFTTVGCGIVQADLARRAAEEREAKGAGAIEACQAGYSNRIERAKCLNDAENRIFAGAIPHPDLMHLRQAYRVAIATKVQEKKLTDDQGTLEFARITAEITAEEERRNNNRKSANAQVASAEAGRTAALGNLYSGLAAMQLASRPTPSPSVTCMRAGNMVTCN